MKKKKKKKKEEEEEEEEEEVELGVTGCWRKLHKKELYYSHSSPSQVRKTK
jgi:hypothetical protein